MLTRHLITRLLLFIPTLLIASLLVFLVIRALPGDVAGAILGGSGESIHREEQLESLRQELGLRDPLPLQYGKWVLSLVDGTFGGRSLADRQPLRTTLWNQAPVTLLLILYALALALLISIPLGVLAAVYQDRWPDYLIRTVTIAGQTLPAFVAGLLAVLGLSYFFQWTPPIIYNQPWQNPYDHLSMMLWPALVLAWGLASVATRVIRAGVLEVLRQDYITLARIKGLTERRVLSGLKAGWLDLVKQRLLDALLAFPPLLVAMLVVAGFGPSSNALLAALAAAFTPMMARLSRSLTVGLKQEAFVMKSVVHGSGTARLLFRHLLPNSLGPITVLGAAMVGEAVAIEAGMSFLGLGVPPPDPSWGRMVQESAHQFLDIAPWLTLFPALAIALAVFSVNFFADALRDLLDPIIRQTSRR